MGKLFVKRYKNIKLRRKMRQRAKVFGTVKHRLVVFRSNKHIYAQIVDGLGKTLAGVVGKNPVEVGQEIAKKAGTFKVKQAVFDRGPYRYHGRVKAVAEAARKGGIKI